MRSIASGRTRRADSRKPYRYLYTNLRIHRSGWRLNHGAAVGDIDVPTLLVHPSVMHPVQRHEVIQLGCTTVPPVDVFVPIGRRRWSIAPRESAALVSQDQCGADM